MTGTYPVQVCGLDHRVSSPTATHDNAIQVSNISPTTSEQTLKDFFKYVDIIKYYEFNDLTTYPL